MTTNELVRLLREADPTGDATVLAYDSELDDDLCMTIVDHVGTNPTKAISLLRVKAITIKEALS